MKKPIEISIGEMGKTPKTMTISRLRYSDDDLRFVLRSMLTDYLNDLFAREEKADATTAKYPRLRESIK